MFYLRFVRNHNVFTPALFDAGKAASGLADRGGGKTSVYRVESEGVADRVATLYAMSGKMKPEDIDYVLIPEDCLAALGIPAAADPGDIQHPLLRQTHYELDGLQDEIKRRDLAEAIRNHPAFSGKRLRPTQLIELARAEVRDAQTADQAKSLIDGKSRWLPCL